MDEEMTIDAPPNFLIDSTTTLKVKTTKGQRVRVRSLAYNTLVIEGRAGTPGWGLGQMTNESIIHTDLHKPNNKLVNV
jgi:hypothetical protein